MITARPLVETDLHAAIALLHAYDRRWFGEPVLTREDVEAEWRTPGFELETDSEGWEDEGELVAFGTLSTRAGIEIAVREDWAGAGLEAAVLDRWEGEARRRGIDAVHHDLPAADTESLTLLGSRGWTVERRGWLLALAPEVPVERRDLPPGYAVRPMREDDLAATFVVVRDAFGGYQTTRRTFEQWHAWTVDRSDVVLDHCRVATWSEEVVGACLLMEPPGGDDHRDEAWVPQLAVAQEHRRRGLARELLAATALGARDRGVSGLALYTHSDTGALGLYERFGMVVRHHLLECTLEL